MIGIYSECRPARRPIAGAMPPLVSARRHGGIPHGSADVERASWTRCARAGWRTGAFEARNRPMQRQRRRRSPAPAGGGRQVPCTPLGGCCEAPTGAWPGRAGRAGAGHAAPAWAGPRATALWRRTRGGRAPARRMQGSVPGAPGARARHGARAPAPSAGTGRSAARCAQSKPASPPLWHLGPTCHARTPLRPEQAGQSTAPPLPSVGRNRPGPRPDLPVPPAAARLRRLQGAIRQCVRLAGCPERIRAAPSPLPPVRMPRILRAQMRASPGRPSQSLPHSALATAGFLHIRPRCNRLPLPAGRAAPARPAPAPGSRR